MWCTPTAGTSSAQASGAADAGADQQGADQARAGGIGHAVEVGHAPARPRPGSAGSAAAACGHGRGWPVPAPPRRTRRAGRSGCTAHARAGRGLAGVVDGHAGFVAGGFDAEDSHGALALRGLGGYLAPAREAAAIIRGSPDYPRMSGPCRGRNPGREFRSFHAERQSPRKRAVRVCPAPLQAHLREGRRARRNPQARVLREADPGAQAQGRRRGEAPVAPQLARRHQAPAPVLSAVVVPAKAGTRKRRRLFAFLEPNPGASPARPVPARTIPRSPP